MTVCSFRFITSHDIANGEMRPLATLFDSLDQPDLIILSGLHLLEGQTEAFFQQKLEELVVRLQDIPTSLPVHLELASMGKGYFVQALVAQVVVCFS